MVDVNVFKIFFWWNSKVSIFDFYKMDDLILSINICERGVICWDENFNLEY